ncbi:histone mono-ubiquitination 1 isoform X2 [Carex rostrata]
MGSTGEPDRKRRHFTSVSPTAGPMGGPTPTKKKPIAPISEDKKLDLSVLKYKNQKLMEQLEARKMECRALESKYIQLREKQKDYPKTLLSLKESHQQLVGNMTFDELGRRRFVYPEIDGAPVTSEEAYSSIEEDFLSRVMESGTAESSGCGSPNQTNNSLLPVGHVMKEASTSLRSAWSESRKLTTSLLDLVTEKLNTTTVGGLDELDNALRQIDDVHLRHRELSEKIQSQRDHSVQNKAELRRLQEEFACTITELEETNTRLAALKAGDGSQNAPLLFPVLGNKRVNGDSLRDKQKELQNLEATYREQMNLVSERLVNIQRLHEERVETLKKLANMKNTMMDLNAVLATSTYQLLNEQLTRSQSEIEHFRIVAEKLQIEKDKFFWREKESSLKADIGEISQRKNSYYESRFSELEQDLQKLAEERAVMERKLEEALREPGRKQIIVEFKALVSSLPNEMAMMQSELNKYKEASSDLHLLRAEVRSLCSMLKQKENELDTLSNRASHADSEIKRLKAKARDIRQLTHESKLFIDAFKQESTGPRDVMELKDREYKAWAYAESLKMSLDEHILEMRVKEANEAEALSQQRLAAAEADITELRQNLEASRREMGALSVNLKSKHEEGDAYLSEIESIGQAYEDIQTQNQQLLQQIAERDDHNTKLVMEGVQAKQMQEALCLEVQTLKKKMQHSNSLLDLYKGKIVLLDDQLKTLSDQLSKLEQDRWQFYTSLGNAQRKLVDVRAESQKLRQSAEDVLSNLEKSRTEEAELLIELDKESGRLIVDEYAVSVVISSTLE